MENYESNNSQVQFTGDISFVFFLCDIINYTKTKSGVDADKLD